MKFNHSLSNNNLKSLLSHFSPQSMFPNLFTGRHHCREGDTLIVTLNKGVGPNLDTITQDTDIVSDQQKRLAGSMTVTVNKRLPTGSLFISGKKWLTHTDKSEYLYLLGIIQPEDIGANNDISSQRINDVRVLYIGEGSLSERSRHTWTSGYFSSHWSPL